MKPSISQYLRTVQGPIPSISRVSLLPAKMLVTKRLRISTLHPDDIYDLYECRNAPSFTRLAPGLIHAFTSFEDAERYLASCLLVAKDGHLHPWILRMEKTFIGYIFLAAPVRTTDTSRLILEYGIDPNQWGHGFAKEALITLINHHFSTMPHVNKIEGSCLAQNTYSQTVMLQAGMRLVATLEEHHQHLDRFYDLCLFDILRRHWQAAHPHCSAATA